MHSGEVTGQVEYAEMNTEYTLRTYLAEKEGGADSGAMDWGYAYDGDFGVRPLCYLKSEILVSVPGEDDEEKNVEVAEEDRAQLVLIASDRILNALNE